MDLPRTVGDLYLGQRKRLLTVNAGWWSIKPSGVTLRAKADDMVWWSMPGGKVVEGGIVRLPTLRRISNSTVVTPSAWWYCPYPLIITAWARAGLAIGVAGATHAGDYGTAASVHAPD